MGFWLIYKLFFQFKACVALHLTASLRCHTECAQTFKTGYDACSAVNNGVELVLKEYFEPQQPQNLPRGFYFTSEASN